MGHTSVPHFNSPEKARNMRLPRKPGANSSETALKWMQTCRQPD